MRPIFLGLAALALMGASSAVQVPITVLPASGGGPDMFQQQLLDLINTSRAGGGLPPYTYKHDVNFELQRVEIDHPVLKGVPSFSVLDETYGRMYYHPDIQPLMVTNHPTSIPIVVWMRAYKNSRLVMIQPGHGPQIFGNPDFGRLIANTVAWVRRR